MLVYFSPDCEHCQQETRDILKNITAFGDTQIYFITDDPMDRMNVFEKYYKLVDYPNITVGRDYNFEMIKNYNVSGTPNIFVFDRYKQRQITIKGPWAIDSLIDRMKIMKVL